jgi:hypothetical protein
MHIMKRLCISLAFTLGFIGLAAAASASITLNPSMFNITGLEVGAFRESTFPRDTLFPVALPFASSHEISAGPNSEEISSATYDLTDTFFKIEFDHIGNSVRTRISNGQTLARQDGVSTATGIGFSVDVDTPYTIVGHYSAVGLRGKWFRAALRNYVTTGKLYESSQETEAGATAAQVFVLGETAGTKSNILIGSSTGLLNAGGEYTLSVNSVLDNQPAGPAVTGTGSGRVILFLGSVVADTDTDGLSDFDEVVTHDTDPQNSDTDGDGISDGDEVAAGSDPLDENSFPIELPTLGTLGRWALALLLLLTAFLRPTGSRQLRV